MLGEHDFRNFCKMDVEHVLSFRRTIMSFRVVPAPAGGMAGRSVAMLHLRGTAFLWHQVRYCFRAGSNASLWSASRRHGGPQGADAAPVQHRPCGAR